VEFNNAAGRFGSQVQVNPKSEPPRQASRSVLQVTVKGIHEFKTMYTLQATVYVLTVPDGGADGRWLC
uniref:Uncharacterized protein n=1 Tax=Aegilops tauschii subsp. strangulata TaxID=200361 RepID=A0A452Z7P2_AEGTS